MNVRDVVNLVMEEVANGRIIAAECGVLELPERKKSETSCSRCGKYLGILPRLFNSQGWRIIHPQSDSGHSYMICRNCMDEYDEEIQRRRTTNEENPELQKNSKQRRGAGITEEQELAELEEELLEEKQKCLNYMQAQKFHEGLAIRRHIVYLYKQIEFLKGSGYLRERWQVQRDDNGLFRTVSQSD